MTRKILLVDNTSGLSAAYSLYLREAVDRLGPTKFRSVGDAAMAEEEVDEDPVWDVALVDLDLGPGSTNGLAVLDRLARLEQPPATVLVTEPYDVDRVLCCLAARHWFGVSAVHNKHEHPGNEQRDREAFLTVVEHALARKTDLAVEYLQSRKVRAVFQKLVPTGQVVLKWNAVGREANAVSAAAAANLAPSTVHEFVGDHQQHIRALWRHIHEADPTRHVDPAFRRGAETAASDVGNGAPYATAHTFAARQYLFFEDDYVLRRAREMPRKLHTPGPIPHP